MNKKHFSGGLFEDRLFQASGRTKDVERNAQHHSVAQLPAGARPIRFALRAGPCQWEQRAGDTEGRGGDRKTATATLPLSPRSQECGSRWAKGWIRPTQTPIGPAAKSWQLKSKIEVANV